MKNKTTRKPIYRFLFFLLLTLLLFSFSFLYPGTGWTALISVIFTLLAFIMFVPAANRFYAWKRGVQDYLITVRQIKKATLCLRADAFELEIDDHTVIQQLNCLKTIKINPQHIYLLSDTDAYYFPSKSMTQKDYQFLISYFKKESLQITKAIIGR